MAIINTNILTKVNETNPEAVKTIFDAMVDDLIERRQPQDKILFRYSMAAKCPDNTDYDQWIEDFINIAHDAFADYHGYRAMGATINDAGDLVIPEPAEDESEADADAETEDTGETAEVEDETEDTEDEADEENA